MQRDDEIDPSELLRTLSDHKWLIGTITGMSILLSIAYALLATPICHVPSDSLDQRVWRSPSLARFETTAYLPSRSVHGMCTPCLGIVTGGLAQTQGLALRQER